MHNEENEENVWNKADLKNNGDNLVYSDFQKGLWLSKKEKFAERQLYGKQS